jgi:hypothetical protein
MIMSLLYNEAPAGRGGEAIGVRMLLLNFSQTGIPLLFGALGAALGMAPASGQWRLHCWQGVGTRSGLKHSGRRKKETTGRRACAPEPVANSR